MHKSPMILYLSEGEDKSNRPKFGDGLNEFGLNVINIFNLKDLRKMLESNQMLEHSALVILIDNSHPHSRLAISLIRAIFNKAGILIVLNTQNVAEVISYIQAGADNCVDFAASNELISALIWRLLWRIPKINKHNIVNETSTTGDEENWLFFRNGWCIQTPCEEQIKLTTTERLFFQRLLRNPDYKATHEQLVEAIDGNKVAKVSRKQLIALSAIVSRVKKKCSALGVYLPLESLHGKGYMFASGNVQVVFEE